MRKKFILTMAAVGVWITMAAGSAQAKFPSLVPDECTGDAPITSCDLTAVEKTLTNVAQIILGVAGSVALAVFVYGGILYMISAGNPTNVAKATKALRTAGIGLALIILSGSAIKVLLKVLSGA